MQRLFSLLFLYCMLCLGCKKNTYPNTGKEISPIDSFSGVYNGVMMYTYEKNTHLLTGEWQYTYDTSYTPEVLTIAKVSIDSFCITNKNDVSIGLVLKYDSTNKYWINTTTGGHTASGISVTIIPAENRLLFRDHWQYGSYSYAEYHSYIFDGKKQ